MAGCTGMKVSIPGLYPAPLSSDAACVFRPRLVLRRALAPLSGLERDEVYRPKLLHAQAPETSRASIASLPPGTPSMSLNALVFVRRARAEGRTRSRRAATGEPVIGTAAYIGGQLGLPHGPDNRSPARADRPRKACGGTIRRARMPRRWLGLDAKRSSNSSAFVAIRVQDVFARF